MSAPNTAEAHPSKSAGLPATSRTATTAARSVSLADGDPDRRHRGHGAGHQGHPGLPWRLAVMGRARRGEQGGNIGKRHVCLGVIRRSKASSAPPGPRQASPR